MMNDSIILLGCKHTGKTSHGKELADSLELPFLDTDLVIQKIKGVPYKEFYNKKGFPAYLLAEEEACEKIAKVAESKTLVIATGGGICDNAPALNNLRTLGRFVFMHFPLEYSVKRVLETITYNEETESFENLPGWIKEKKPKKMEQVEEIIRENYKARYDQYYAICDEEIVLTGSTKEENTKIILEYFH